MSTDGHSVHKPNPMNFLKLSIGSLGIVYGDLGTSVLYTIQVCFNPENGLALNQNNVLGILSLLFWTMNMVIIFKYIIFVMRADNLGEGGMMALISLLLSGDKKTRLKKIGFLVLLGVFGTCLQLADSVLTPAISVLSAVEGLEVATVALKPLIVPLTILILALLFFFQKKGTDKIGFFFGPIMFCWFLIIGITGLMKIVDAPVVLLAVNPFYAVQFFIHNQLIGFIVLGAVVLCITGGEALYADMGHFGKNPIRYSWIAFVYPCLLLNYFGQGANLILKGSAVVANPFFSLAEGWMLYPMIAIATIATIIASQALISGAFSLTQQAMQLGFIPRMNVIHTSNDIHGQIYVPGVNMMLMAGCIILVAAFQSNAKLTLAYGMAVMGTMTITSVLIGVIAIRKWKWKPWKAYLLTGIFLCVDLPYLAANLAKFLHGAWVPLSIAAGLFLLMMTWKRGREELTKYFSTGSIPIDLFMNDMAVSQGSLQRVRGTAVFMTSGTDKIPNVLLHHFKHNKVLHDKVILLTINIERIPRVPASRKYKLKELGYGFYQITADYGYMEKPDVPALLQKCSRKGLELVANNISYYLGHETLITTGHTKMFKWQKNLFAFLSKNARPASAYFKLPPNRVVELGVQVEI